MRAKTLCAIVLGLLFFAVFAVLMLPRAPALPAIPPLSGDAGAAIWKLRSFDTVLQGIIILSGVMSILLLLGSGRSGREQP